MVYKDIVLDRGQRKVLRKISKGKFNNLNQEDLQFLMRNHLISTVNVISVAYNNAQPQYSLTNDGIMCLTYINADNRRTWYPNVMATLAFIQSLVALYYSLRV